MVDALAAIVLTLHYGVLALLGIYGCHRLSLTFGAHRRAPCADPPLRFAVLPTVTVQLPVFNEKHVVERLIDAAVALDYPVDRVQIQLLDDSTDETTMLAAARIAHHRAVGRTIDHVRRADRSGFKAGALAHGLDRATGEFILVLDADFVPEPDFLRRLIHPLADPAIGMVQARWSYLNRDRNLLTRAQAVLLDGHFAIEQSARWGGGRFFNFNGTAGIWRAQAIRDAGGWRADTLTEDLDLSYRAQLVGWRFAYCRDVTCPSELPVDINAFKSQQFRWAKGATEVMLRLLPRIWAARLPVATRLEASFHLTSNLSYLLLLVDSLVLLAPSIAIRQHYDFSHLLWLDVPLFAVASLSHIGFFWAGQRTLHADRRINPLGIAVLIALVMGLACNNGRAVAEALRGKRSAFVRTPKLGGGALVGAVRGTWQAYRTHLSRGGERAEILLGAAYIACAGWALSQQYWLGAPFPALFALGFLTVGIASMRARAATNGRHTGP